MGRIIFLKCSFDHVSFQVPPLKKGLCTYSFIYVCGQLPIWSYIHSSLIYSFNKQLFKLFMCNHDALSCLKSPCYLKLPVTWTIHNPSMLPERMLKIKVQYWSWYALSTKILNSFNWHPKPLVILPIKICHSMSLKRYDCWLICELDPSTWRFLVPCPVLGIWVPLVFPTPRGCSKNIALR